MSDNGRAEQHQLKKRLRTVLVHGVAAVDPECTDKVKTAHVFSEGNNVYHATLNLTNLRENNNKFYILQVLEENAIKSYSVWFRWGRVGLRGQSKLIPCGDDVEEAKRVFCEKFYAKTLNEWGRRSEFETVPGKYSLVQVEYNEREDDHSKEKENRGGSRSKKMRKAPVPRSKLENKLKQLINLICDVHQMDDCLHEMKYDATRLPLGKLTKEQITAGYESLKKIERCIKSKTKLNYAELADACSEFYTRIPHSFGMGRPPLISDLKMVKNEIALLDVLSDIEVTIRTVKKTSSSKLNPIDNKYNQMLFTLKAVAHAADEFQTMKAYLHNTHGPTHNLYELELVDLFECKRKNGKKKDNGFRDVGNRMMLWHGSRLCNWYSILCYGLKIAPPEAPVTGYMFGKGIYFADISSKAANYCIPTRQKNIGLVSLCEVSLGKPAEFTAADYIADEHLGKCNSAKGIGKFIPDPSGNHEMPDGCIVPLGRPVPNPDTQETSLQYNEYVVYDLSQIRLRYLAKIKFVYDSP